MLSGGGRRQRASSPRIDIAPSHEPLNSQRQASQCGLTTSFNPDPLRQASQARSAHVVASSQTGLTTHASAGSLARTLGRMNETVAPYPGLQRAGRTLIAAGLVGFFGFILLGFLLPVELPQNVREDRLRLSAKPSLHSQSRAPAYLELTDGAMPARIPNFESIEPQSTRQTLRSLEPGTEVTVLRPLAPTTWFNGYDILALRTEEREVLTIEATLAAHATKASRSKTFCLVIAAIGVSVLALRGMITHRPNAA